MTEEPIKYSISKIIAMAKKHGNMIEKQAKAGCEKWSVKAPFKGQEYRDKMLACKAAAAIKGLNASAAFAKKLTPHCKEQGYGNKCKKGIYGFLVDVKDDIKDNQSYLKRK